MWDLGIELPIKGSPTTTNTMLTGWRRGIAELAPPILLEHNVYCLGLAEFAFPREGTKKKQRKKIEKIEGGMLR